MKLTRSVMLAALAGTLATAAAQAQPAYVLTGQIWGDLSADGMTAAGTLFDPILQKQVVYTYTRGVGALSTGAIQDGGALRCNTDATSISFDAYDLENVSGLGTTRLVPHLWTLAGGETNLGVAPGTTTCDAFTCSSNDISGNGRYIVGDGYTTRTCGPLVPYRYDTLTHVWEQLPTVAQSRVAHALAASTDGTVVCGLDDANPAQTQFEYCAVVWVKSGSVWTRTVLDPIGGKTAAVSADGNTVVGYMNATTMYNTFGTSVTTPVRWTRSGSTWTPHDMGGDNSMRPVAVSADGGTVVGGGGDGSGFIWRASINGGVAMNLDDYVFSLGGTFPDFAIASGVSRPVFALSADGNAVMVSLEDFRNTCLTWFPSAILYLNGTTCEPANILLPPVSHFNPLGPIVEPFGMTFNCFAAGSWPLNFQWQKETTPGSGVWTDLADDNCAEYIPDFFDFRGTTTMQLRLGALSGIWSGRYRCVVSNECGSSTSPAFVAAVCHADYNCDGFMDGLDYDQFNADYESYDPAQQIRADYNSDGFVDGLDYDLFNADFETGC